MKLRALIAVCFYLAVPTTARNTWGRVLGPNCTVRAELHECITNPLFMEKDCRDECRSEVYLDVDYRFCRRNMRNCIDRQGKDEWKNFVFNKCNRTCRNQYRRVELILTPNDFWLLIYAVLPFVYCTAISLLLCHQLLAIYSNWLMVRLEELKPRYPYFAGKIQAGLMYVCDNQDSVESFGPQAVGRLFVCGYYVVEGGLLVGFMALVVYLGPKFKLHRKNPKLMRNSITMLLVYTFLEAWFTILKGYVVHKFNSHEHPDEMSDDMHQPVYVEGELTCKKMAMMGVSLLFIQSSRKQMMAHSQTALQKSIADDLDGEENVTPVAEYMKLAGRLLMAGLFCFVGVIEGQRVWSGQLHDPPDGHDHIWPKLVQLLFLVPFTLGYKTKFVTQMLAISLVLEAMTAWMFWREMCSDLPTLVHAIHSKDHFATNIAVAGGLFLIQEAPGKYTLDAYMKKKD